MYAGLGLWRPEVLARLAEAQLVADGIYPNAAAVFAEAGAAEAGGASPALDFSPVQLRAPDGRWTAGSRSARLLPASDPEEGEEEVEKGTAGGVPPADGPVSSLHQPPLRIVPGAGTHGLLGRVPSPLTAVPVALRVPAVSPAKSLSPQQNTSAIAVPSSPASVPAQPLSQTMQDLARVTRGFAGPKSAQKWLNQMNDRGWTPEQIEESISDGKPTSEWQRVDPTHGATRYVHLHTGRSVTIDDVTGQIIQLGGDDFDH